MGAEIKDQTEKQYSHIQSYLCRKSLISLIEQSQYGEHEFLNRIEVLTEKHTNKIIDRLVDWLEAGHQASNDEEIRLISELSGVDVSVWVVTKELISKNYFDLAQCDDAMSKKKSFLQGLNPLRNRIFGSDADKAQIRSASEDLDRAKSKKESLENAKQELVKKAKNLALDILKNTCANMHLIDGEHGLFGELKKVSYQTMGEASNEISSHVERQLKLIEEIEMQVASLKSLYLRGVA